MDVAVICIIHTTDLAVRLNSTSITRISTISLKTGKHRDYCPNVEFSLHLQCIMQKQLFLLSTFHFGFPKSHPNHITGHGSHSREGNKASKAVGCKGPKSLFYYLLS